MRRKFFSLKLEEIGMIALQDLIFNAIEELY